MNRRSNKILRELILGSRQNVTELVEKYKVQERSIRADIKELNDALIEYDLPVIQIGSDGEVFFDTDVRVDVHAFEKFICEHTFYTCLLWFYILHLYWKKKKQKALRIPKLKLR